MWGGWLISMAETDGQKFYLKMFFQQKIGSSNYKNAYFCFWVCQVCMKYLQTWLLSDFAWVVCCDISRCRWFPFVIILFIKEVCRWSRAPTLPQLQTLDKWMLRGVVQIVNLLHRSERDQGPKLTLRWLDKNSTSKSSFGFVPNYFGLWLFPPWRQTQGFSPLCIFTRNSWVVQNTNKPHELQLNDEKTGHTKKFSKVFRLAWVLNRRQNIIRLLLLIFTLPSSNLELLKTASKWSKLELFFSTLQWKKGRLLFFSVPLNGSANLLVCRYVLKASDYTPIVKWKDSEYSVQKLAVSAIWSS